MLVEHAGKFKDRARLGIRFHSLVLADGTRMSMQTETIFRDGDSPTGPAASKVGASAVVGGIIGAVVGGKKGRSDRHDRRRRGRHRRSHGRRNEGGRVPVRHAADGLRLTQPW